MFIHHRSGLCLLTQPGQYHSVQHYHKYATLFLFFIFMFLEEAEAQSPSSGDVFNMMVLYGAFAPFPQGSRLVEVHV